MRVVKESCTASW